MARLPRTTPTTDEALVALERRIVALERAAAPLRCDWVPAADRWPSTTSATYVPVWGLITPGQMAARVWATADTGADGDVQITADGVALSTVHLVGGGQGYVTYDVTAPGTGTPVAYQVLARRTSSSGAVRVWVW